MGCRHLLYQPELILVMSLQDTNNNTKTTTSLSRCTADNWAEERSKPLRGVLSDFGHVRAHRVETDAPGARVPKWSGQSMFVKPTVVAETLNRP